MVKVIAPILSCFWIGLASAALADTPAANKAEEKIDKVLSFYQTEGFFDSSLTYVKEALQTRQEEIKIPDHRQETIAALAARIYRKKNLISVFRAIYAVTIKPEDLEALLKWMATPEGIKLEKAYAQAYAVNAGRQRKIFLEKHGENITANRQNSINTFMASTGQVEQYTIAKAGAYYGVLLALSAYLPAKDRETTAFIQEKAYGRKIGYVDAARSFWLKFDSWMLHELADQDIDEASKFGTSTPGQAATKAYATALEQTLNRAANTLFQHTLKEANK